MTVHIPNAEVEKVLEAVTAAVPLDYGFYDQVAFLDAPGQEQFRGPSGSGTTKGAALPTEWSADKNVVGFDPKGQSKIMAKHVLAIMPWRSV